MEAVEKKREEMQTKLDEFTQKLHEAEIESVKLQTRVEILKKRGDVK